MSRAYDEAVAGWAAHLSSGGTTTWRAWVDGPGQPTVVPDGPSPDAVHLELVRLLNLAGNDDPRLAAQVLAIASPGRGLVDVPLPWPEPRPYGSPAIDPGELPAEELVRLAAGLLVHLLPGTPRPTSEPEPRPWPIPWRRRFRLHGSPGTAAAVRRGLLAAGLVETDWRPTHVVLARPLESMMAEHWAGNARLGGVVRWNTLWRRAEAEGRLPPPIDPVGLAESLAGRKKEPVHVVVGRDPQEVAEVVARLLGARPVVVPGGGDLAQTDLFRRVNRLTALVHGPGRVRDLASRLAAVLTAVPAGGTPGPVPGETTAPPVVPRGSRDWARRQAWSAADRLRVGLRDGHYAVHGSPDDLVPAASRQPGTVDRHRTLEIAVAACLRAWHLQGGTP